MCLFATNAQSGIDIANLTCIITISTNETHKRKTMYKSYAEIVDLLKCRDLILVARDGKLESYTDGKFSVAQSVCGGGKVPVVMAADVVYIFIL